MAKVEAVSSPANPLLKDVRRAMARGGLTEEGYCVAETFHLLEEALRSDSGVGIVLMAMRSGPRATSAGIVKLEYSGSSLEYSKNPFSLDSARRSRSNT